MSEFETLLKARIDIVDLECSRPYFINQLLQNNTLVIYKNIHRRVGFEVRSRRVYFDMVPFYDLYHKKHWKDLSGVNHGRAKCH